MEPIHQICRTRSRAATLTPGFLGTLRVLAVITGLLSPTTPAPGDARDIAPGGNLVIEGIPRIPASLAEEVRPYTEHRSAMLADWHPTRREMLIRTRFGNTMQVHHVRFPGGARTQLTFLTDPVGDATYHPKLGKYFVFTRGTDGGEFYQNYRYDFASGAITLLTDGKSRNHLGVWSNAGDRMAYGSTRRNGRDVDLYVVDPSAPNSDRLLAPLEGGGWSVMDWSPDDRRLLVSQEISINESYLWLVDLATGKKTLLTPRGGSQIVSYGQGKFSKDGRRLYVTTDRDSEFQRLTAIDLATRRHTELTRHIPWDVDQLDLSPDGRRLAFVTNEEGTGVLRLLDTATGKERPVPRLPGGSVFGIQWHKNSQDLAFHLVSTRTAMDIYSLHLPTGRVVRWSTSETGGLVTRHLPDPQLIRWRSFDGKRISGYLYRPPARFTGKRPVILQIHGGPEGQFRPGFRGRDYYYLNVLGVAMIFPNIRGSSGYGKTFLKLDNGVLREDAYKDIGALLDWIRQRPDLDADRIMVTGGSYGGHMTLAVATYYGDRIRCAVDIVGPSNFVTFLEKTAGYRQDLRRVEYGDERDPVVRRFLERIAPLNNAHKITKPLFVIQGQNDPRVPLSESEQMVAAIRKNGAPVWYLMARDEGHGFAKKENADFQFYATILFVKEHLLK